MVVIVVASLRWWRESAIIDWTTIPWGLVNVEASTRANALLVLRGERLVNRWTERLVDKRGVRTILDIYNSVGGGRGELCCFALFKSRSLRKSEWVVLEKDRKNADAGQVKVGFKVNNLKRNLDAYYSNLGSPLIMNERQQMEKANRHFFKNMWL